MCVCVCVCVCVCHSSLLSLIPTYQGVNGRTLQVLDDPSSLCNEVEYPIYIYTITLYSILHIETSNVTEIGSRRQELKNQKCKRPKKKKKKRGTNAKETLRNSTF